MAKMRVVNVFSNEQGKFGNPVGIIADIENKISKENRQEIAKQSSFSEVVFINDVASKNISIYSPQREIPFAGHAAVGAAYFLSNEYNMRVAELSGIGGKIITWQENDFVWVKCSLDILPKWNYEQLKTTNEVEELTPAQMTDKQHTVIWAWIDEKKGIVRARTFASDWGIIEDEANGSGSMKLAVMQGRELIIHHGKGSVIHARPSSVSNYAEVGGSVTNKGIKVI
jgi:predicted PhzF superfamily epimerase YddE/YHI9